MEGLTASFCLVSETTSASPKWTSMCEIKNYVYIEYKKKLFNLSFIVCKFIFMFMFMYIIIFLQIIIKA